MIATGTISLLSQATTTQYTTYTPFSNYVEDSRGVVTTYFTLNGTLVGAYSYQKGNEASTGKITFAHTNYLGTPVIETDDKGDIVQMDITDVFGNYVQRNQRNDNAYHSKSYTGHEFDDVSGNLYAHARYLNSPSHTFLSVDPMLYKIPDSYLNDPQQMNSYAYARNNPIVYTDPDGKFILPLLAAAALVSIVAANVLPVYYALTNAPTPQLQASIGVQQSLTGILGSVPIKGGGAYTGFATPSTGAIKTTSNTAIVGKTSTPAPKASTGANISGSSKQSLPEVTVSRSRYPEASQHIQDAQASGKPSVLTIDRSGASERRQTSLSGISTQSGFDRDEYPPAMFKEGGFGSSVRYINPRDNRGAGSCIGIQCRDYPDGTQIELKVIDY
jgi:RHS repeat-associated protein